MQTRISPIIKPHELLSLKQSDDLVIIDARAGADAKEKYAAGHLDGALFVDLNKDLAEIKADPADGGRHPLPDPAKFSGVLKNLGIALNTPVVIYDDKNGSNAAARFWWMLRATGHTQARILDGGFQAAVTTGFPVSSKEEIPVIQNSNFFDSWKLPLATMSEVEEAVKDDAFIVIDVRDKVRYDGETEPFDRVAGHIPGAVNIPFVSNLDTAGNFLPASELKEKYLLALKGRAPENVIIHCGSGVTACHTILAMDHAGIEIPKLYVGSWSEWCNNDKPMATKEMN